jgi:hypothetical protein
MIKCAETGAAQPAESVRFTDVVEIAGLRTVRMEFSLFAVTRAEITISPDAAAFPLTV